MSNEKLYKKLLKFIFFLSLFAPLAVDRHLFFPYSTGATLYFHFVTQILVVLWVPFVLAYKKYRPKFNFLNISVAIYLVALSLATIFSVSSYLSFWGDAERMMGLFSYFHFFALFFVGTTLFRNREEVKGFLRIFVVASFIVALYGVLQRLGLTSIYPGEKRIVSTLGNPSSLASYLIFGLFFSSLLFFKSKSKNWKIFFGISLLIHAIALFLTGTRGAYIGVFGGGMIFVLCVLSNLKNNKKVRNSIFAGLGVLAIAIIFLFASKNSDFVQNTPILRRVTNPFDTTAQTRFLTWKWGLESFKEKPIIGYGLENFAVPFNKNFKSEYYSITDKEYFDRAHNIIVELLVTTGVVGLASYLLLLSAVSLIIFKARKNYLYAGAMGGLVSAYFLQNLFVFDLLPSMLGFMAFLIVCAGYKGLSNEEAVGGIKKYLTIPVFLILLGAFIYGLNPFFIKPYKALKDSVIGQILINENYEQSLAYLKRSISYGTYLDLDLRSVMANAIYHLYVESGIERENKKEDVDFAAEMYKKNLEIVPNDAYYHYKLAEIKNFRFSIDLKVEHALEAREHINKAIELSPNRARLYYILVENYLMDGRLDQAIETAKKAVELNPEFGESQWELTKAYFMTNKYEEAKESLVKTIDLNHHISEENIMMFAPLFDITKDVNNLIEFYELVIKNGTTNYLYYSTIATRYYEIGEYDLAIERAKQSAEMQPSTKEKVEKFIKEAEEKKRSFNSTQDEENTRAPSKR